MSRNCMEIVESVESYMGKSEEELRTRHVSDLGR